MSQRAESRSAKQEKTRKVRIAILATVGLAVVIVGVAIIIGIVNGSSQTVAAEQAAAAQSGPAPGAIDFQPSHELDTGMVEGLPASAVKAQSYPNLLSLGSMAPDFQLVSATGEKVRLSDYRGRTVLLEFFATWCPHCQAEAPHLKSIMASLPETSFAMLQVTVDSEDAASLLAFDRYYGVTTPSLMDPGVTPGSFYHQGSTGPVTKEYRIGVFPTFYVIDPKGRIAWRADHEQPDALLLQKLKDAAAGP